MDSLDTVCCEIFFLILGWNSCLASVTLALTSTLGVLIEENLSIDPDLEGLLRLIFALIKYLMVTTQNIV